ncbi:MAG: (Fe-S)-binding protein [Proteobacteria bacterium]|nr:(Fe-S)-binding protein [Pseudomonadota bacterium]
MKKCFRCSLCKMVPLPTILNAKYADGCPANRQFHFHGYSGSGKNIMALSLLDGRIEVDETLAEIVFACTACGLCDVACKFIMEAERHRVNMTLREHLVDEGFGRFVHRQAIENLELFGNPDGQPNGSTKDWAVDLGVKILPAIKAPVLLFAGCMQNSDPDSARVSEKLARLLTQAGVDFGILPGAEPSCGLPAYWTGHRNAFTEFAKRLNSLFDSLEVETIVTVSGSCLGTLRSKYPEYIGAPQARVVHAVEFLTELIENGRLRLPKPVKRRVTYHDPCCLGRQSEPPLTWDGEYKTTHGCMTYTDPIKEINRGVNGVFDEPRRLLGAVKGLDFVEMHRIREYSFCCGGGGGVPQAYPKLAATTAIHRLEEADDVGADCLVTACHECRKHLSKSRQFAEDELLPVADIIDVVYEAADIS